MRGGRVTGVAGPGGARCCSLARERFVRPPCDLPGLCREHVPRSLPTEESAQTIKMRGCGHLPRYERVLRTGTPLEIRVTRPSFIDRYTRLVIREVRAPLGRDRCLTPLPSRPVACRSG
jgi:hypothetical protein